MELSNNDRINSFGYDNSTMSDQVPHRHLDLRVGNIHNYLDMRIIKKWVLPLFPKDSQSKIAILDVGAGTGRMTRWFSKIADLCVSIEPYPDFFNRLKTSCTESNVELHQCTLQDYIKIANHQFNLIYLSGVIMYHNDAEALKALQLIQRLLKPGGIVIIRDSGIEDKGWGNSPFGSVQTQLKTEILRPPKGMLLLINQAGFKCLKWRRLYPPVITSAIHEFWPNALTNWLLSFSSNKLFYPFWGLLDDLNLKHKNLYCYFVYLLQTE